MGMEKQLVFDLPVRPALGREAFLVSDANALAIGMVDRWQSWPEGKLLVSGAEGAGKTHLACVFAEQSGGQMITPAQLDAATDTCATVVEDLHQLHQSGPNAERALFHLHNRLREARLPLMMTGRGQIKDWGLSLPDLISRLEGATTIALDQPDDALIAGMLVKQFDDRQLQATPDLVSFLVTRIDRSGGAVRDIVDRLDKAALTKHRKLNRALAVDVLGGAFDGA